MLACRRMFEDPRQPPLTPTPPVRTQPLLELGRVVATPGALAALTTAGVSPERYLFRHSCGDWGKVDAHDWAANDRALEEGTRVLSAYSLPGGGQLWVITEWDRSATTMLLPQEY